MAYTDGATSGTNPGESGCGVAFFSQEFEEGEEDDDELVELLHSDKIDNSCETGPQKQKESLTFLCSAQIYIGPATSNYAEYVGLILAQLLFAINEKHDVAIRMDSMLITNQVKGVNQVRNTRLVHIIPIVHDLIKHFTSLKLDWIPREENAVADAISKEAATQIIGFDPRQPDLFKLKFS